MSFLLKTFQLAVQQELAVVLYIKCVYYAALVELRCCALTCHCLCDVLLVALCFNCFLLTVHSGS